MKKQESNLEYWKLTKQQAMKLLTEANKLIEDVMIDKEANETVIEMCDHEIAAILKDGRDLKKIKGQARIKVTIALVVITILVLLSIILTSCQTIKGVAGDTGWILTKMSDNIQIENERSK